jgi:NAD(P)-dependent dehydrogenase (short-subunit alcohol dehydrogenase family)
MAAGGSVVLNTSIHGVQGRAGFSVYAAAKAAVRSLARSLTAELSAKGTGVNALAPGPIDTEIMRKVGMSDEMIEQVMRRPAPESRRAAPPAPPTRSQERCCSSPPTTQPT